MNEQTRFPVVVFDWRCLSCGAGGRFPLEPRLDGMSGFETLMISTAASEHEGAVRSALPKCKRPKIVTRIAHTDFPEEVVDGLIAPVPKGHHILTIELDHVPDPGPSDGTPRLGQFRLAVMGQNNPDELPDTDYTCYCTGCGALVRDALRLLLQFRQYQVWDDRDDSGKARVHRGGPG